MTTVALIVLAVIFAGAGGAKLAGAAPIKANFERFDLSDQHRLGIGAIEVVLAVLALVALGADDLALPVGVAALVVMAGALATHARVKDPLPEWVPAIVTTVAAIAVVVTA